MKSDPTAPASPLCSIGTLLSTERESRGIPVEKAAKDTRMRAQHIRDMENDDLSAFTNPSYARMFIVAYAKYLGIPLQRVSEFLPERGEASSEGYHYASRAAPGLPSLRPDIASRSPGQGHLLRNLVGIALLLVLIGAGFFIYYLAVNIDRLTKERAAPRASTPTIYLRSAEETLHDQTIIDEKFLTYGGPLSARVNPTPSNDPLATTLSETIVIIPREPLTSEDLASDEPTTLENSMPAATSEPTPPELPLTGPIEADRAFLLQTTE